MIAKHTPDTACTPCTRLVPAIPSLQNLARYYFPTIQLLRYSEEAEFPTAATIDLDKRIDL